jgi:predicted dienelactone hydrolase
MDHNKECVRYLTVSMVISVLFAIIGCRTGQAPPFSLPEPTGPYAVGIKNFHFTDKNRPEIFTPEADDHRELFAIIWYPAESPSQGTPVSLMEQHQEKAAVFKRFAPVSDSAFELISRVISHSYRDVPVARGKQPYPLLVFSHAYWAGLTQSTVLMEELASHGYVVVSIAHPHETPYTITADGSIKPFDPMNERLKHIAEERKATFEYQKRLSLTRERDELEELIKSIHDGRERSLESITIWVEDIRFILDALETMNLPGGFFSGTLDTGNVGVLGHSFGGAVSGQACIVDERIKAGINMDGLQLGGLLEQKLTKPFMFMHHDNVGAENKMINLLFFERAEKDAYLLVIEGTRHLNFSDISLPGYGELLQLPPEALGPIDGYRCLEIINNYTVAFFNKYLKCNETALLGGASPDHPEVEIVVRTVPPTSSSKYGKSLSLTLAAREEALRNTKLCRQLLVYAHKRGMQGNGLRFQIFHEPPHMEQLRLFQLTSIYQIPQLFHPLPLLRRRKQIGESQAPGKPTITDGGPPTEGMFCNGFMDRSA